MIHSIPLMRKQKMNVGEINIETNYVIQDHLLRKNTRVIILDKLTTREIYSVNKIHQFPKNILTKQFQIKILIGSNFVHYQECSL